MLFRSKQKTYEISSRDWSSDVCSSDLAGVGELVTERHAIVERAHDYGEPPPRLDGFGGGSLSTFA